MLDKKNIDAFVNYKFIPFNKVQCVKRLVIVWVLSAILCFIGDQFILWMVPFGIINLIISIAAIILIAKFSDSVISRHLCDGIFCLYVSVILNLTSYKVLTSETGPNWVLAIVLLFLLLICILIFLLITLSNIKADKFSKESTPNGCVSLPFIGGVCGIYAARIFIQGQSQQMVSIFGASAFLILSFLLSMPTMGLLKAWFYMQQNNK